MSAGSLSIRRLPWMSNRNPWLAFCGRIGERAFHGAIGIDKFPVKARYYDIGRKTRQIEYLLGHRLSYRSGFEVTRPGKLTAGRRVLLGSLFNARRRLGSIMWAGQDHWHDATMSFHQ